MSRNRQPPTGFPIKTVQSSRRGSESLRRHVTLRDMVLTPDTVPPFTIPPLCALALPQARAVTETGSCLLAAELELTDELHSVWTPPDPAMTLLHLAKVTTPYGFVTLAERPRVRRRESLFFDYEVADKPTRSDSSEQRRL